MVHLVNACNIGCVASASVQYAYKGWINKASNLTVVNYGIVSSEGREILEDGLPVVAESLLAAYDSGELLGALEEGKSGWQKWVKAFGKSLKRKGKSLFMPLRVLLTGKLHGPDMGDTIVLIYRAGTNDIVTHQVGFVPLEQRLESLKQVNWETFNKVEPATVASH